MTFTALCRTAANGYRLGKEAEASKALLAVLDALPQLAPELLEDPVFARLIDGILTAKSQRDHHYLSDLLVHELAVWVAQRTNKE